MLAARVRSLGDQHLHFAPERQRRLARGVDGPVLLQPCVVVPPPSYEPSTLYGFL